MNHSLHITTQRLELLPCSLGVAQAAAIKNKPEVERLLGVSVSDDWYASEVLDILPTYAQMLIDDPSQLGRGVCQLGNIDSFLG